MIRDFFLLLFCAAFTIIWLQLRRLLLLLIPLFCPRHLIYILIYIMSYFCHSFHSGVLNSCEFSISRCCENPIGLLGENCLGIRPFVCYVPMGIITWRRRVLKTIVPAVSSTQTSPFVSSNAAHRVCTQHRAQRTGKTFSCGERDGKKYISGMEMLL